MPLAVPSFQSFFPLLRFRSPPLVRSSTLSPLHASLDPPIAPPSRYTNLLSTRSRSPSAQPRTRTYEDVLDCVLKVYCTHCEPNYELPWAMTAQRHSTSSAFIIPGRKILTNAHSVEHYTSVLVKKRYDDSKYAAKVVAIGNECDIALLAVENEEFWREFESHIESYESRVPYLVPGELPQLQDSVLVMGYPSPGNQISVTAGVASRVEMLDYLHGEGELLAVQIDAAINPGNSGGPVINESHEVIGIAFQSLDPSQADSVGYFIPYCVVDHFLQDIALHKRYTGFPYCGFRWQRMENRHLRRALGMTPDRSGILVKWVAETCDASCVLQKGDIITHIDGVSVSNAGTVPFRCGERIGLNFLVTSKFTNDMLKVTLWRNGEQRQESFRLSRMGEHRLVHAHDARHLVRRQPEYILYGGLVFQVLSEPFLRAVYGPNWLSEAPVKLVDQYYQGMQTRAGRKELIVLAQILATESTTGYEEEEGNHVMIVRRLNEREVNSLQHLAQLIDKCEESTEYLRFQLEGDAVIIIDREVAKGEEAATLATHCIPATRFLGPQGADLAAHESYNNNM